MGNEYQLTNDGDFFLFEQRISSSAFEPSTLEVKRLNQNRRSDQHSRSDVALCRPVAILNGRNSTQRPSSRTTSLRRIKSCWRWLDCGSLEEPCRRTMAESFTVITTDSNELTSDVHDRMPAILDQENFDIWSDPEFQDTDKLKSLLVPYGSGAMEK